MILETNPEKQAVLIRKAFPDWTEEQVMSYARKVCDYHVALDNYQGGER